MPAYYAGSPVNMGSPMPRIPRFGRSDADTALQPSAADLNAAPDHDDEPPTTVMATPAFAPGNAPPTGDSPATDQPAGAEPSGGGTLSFAERARARRRLRFLRRARELGFRDLGGLVFDLHRFGRERADLVAAKVHTLAVMDQELRALETLLRERRTVTVLHEPGIVACPRCAAIHGTESNYCPNCGLPTGGRADMPMAVPAPGASGATEQTPASAIAPSAPASKTPTITTSAPGGETDDAVPAQPPTPDDSPSAQESRSPASPVGPASEIAAAENGADPPEPAVWRAANAVPELGAAPSDDRPLQR